MNKKEFLQLIKDEIVILDGATGTELQKKGLPVGECPEKWLTQHKEVLKELQTAYVEAGSRIIYAPTFGANRLKLEEYGLENEIVEINETLVKISKEVMGDQGYVAGDIAPTGKSMIPFGFHTFDDILNAYKEQAKILFDAGVDLFVIETMMGLQEARAALIAVKEVCDLPVMVSMTYEQNGRTLNGTDPVSALVTLQSLGADAVGCNCSTGPQAMKPIISQMLPYAKVPILIKPNAGLPKFINGETVFDMDADTFVKQVEDLVELGVHIVGGCCGTTPDFIKALKQSLNEIVPKKIGDQQGSVVTSERQYVEFDNETIIVGERINPTGKKKLQEALRANNFDYVTQLAKEQLDLGAKVLDINIGMNDINEPEIMEQLLTNLCLSVHAPLCIDSSNIEAIEKALRIYPGRALVNSISLEKEKIEKLLPITAKYGAMFILLPLSDKGLPSSAEEKKDWIQKIYDYAQKYDFKKEDILVDGLVTTVASNAKAAVDVLNTIDWCTHEIKLKTIMGLSNISFGLPERAYINTAFLAMAIQNGLSAAIANPSNEMFMAIKYASDLLIQKDALGKNYIQHFQLEEYPIGAEENLVYKSVIDGEKDKICNYIKHLLDDGVQPKTIVDESMIPAIMKVGDLFEEEIYFLPQLIRSAETMETGLKLLEPLLFDTIDTKKSRSKIILATVKGDVHDIGKNLVSLMLKNYGYEVYDMGKDVDREDIINKAKEVDADIIGLSALMTTTMIEMKQVIRRVKEEQLKVKVMIGGAVITKEYADEIGAYYSKDAQEAVKVVQEILNN